MRKNYSEEHKKEILSRYRSGETLSSICKNTGISKSTLYQWAKIYNLKKRKELNLTDVRILRQRCEKYEKMMEILQMYRKTGYFSKNNYYNSIKPKGSFLSKFLGSYFYKSEFLTQILSLFEFRCSIKIKIRKCREAPSLLGLYKENDISIEPHWFGLGMSFTWQYVSF